MTRFTWHEDSVMVEYDNDESELFRVGDVVARNVLDYSKTAQRWIGVITSVWTAGQQMLVAEFPTTGYAAYSVKNVTLGEKDVEDTDLALVVDPMVITTEFSRLQAKAADNVYSLRRTLESAENELDYVSSVFAPIRFSAAERHRVNHIEPAQSAEAIIRDLVMHGMLPPDQAAAEALREAEQMFPEMEVDK